MCKDTRLDKNFVADHTKKYVQVFSGAKFKDKDFLIEQCKNCIKSKVSIISYSNLEGNKNANTLDNNEHHREELCYKCQKGFKCNKREFSTFTRSCNTTLNKRNFSTSRIRGATDKIQIPISKSNKNKSTIINIIVEDTNKKTKITRTRAIKPKTAILRTTNKINTLNKKNKLTFIKYFILRFTLLKYYIQDFVFKYFIIF